MSIRQIMSDAVDRSFDAISRFVAPAMPWLFLALRRALIATLAAVIVAVLFFVVPQSREVLHIPLMAAGVVALIPMLVLFLLLELLSQCRRAFSLAGC